VITGNFNIKGCNIDRVSRILLNVLSSCGNFELPPIDTNLDAQLITIETEDLQGVILPGCEYQLSATLEYPNLQHIVQSDLTVNTTQLSPNTSVVCTSPLPIRETLISNTLTLASNIFTFLWTRAGRSEPVTSVSYTADLASSIVIGETVGDLSFNYPLSVLIGIDEARSRIGIADPWSLFIRNVTTFTDSCGGTPIIAMNDITLDIGRNRVF
jgi:hypothetical protein